MNSFSFDATAGASQSTSKPRLAGNAIYNVKFDSCEPVDIQGVKDPSVIYKVLRFRFSNDDGTFEHTVFEPQEKDFKRTETEFKNKNGNTEKIPQASNVESMMLFFKHVIDGFVPEIAEKIDKKEVSITAKNWDELRTKVVTLTTKGKGRTSYIKLVEDKNGDAKFPSFFAGVSREGLAYVRNNFIGNKLAFSTYEIQKINEKANARITPAEDFIPEIGTSTPDLGDSGLDLDFEVGNL